MSSHDDEVSQLAAATQRGSVVAAAGCGKTEQIARATGLSHGRRLILTHTHAGVDALKTRLKKHGIGAKQFRIDTIAGWALRFVSSYPARSGLQIATPSGDEWGSVYEAAATLISSGAVSGVLTASYSGLFVDEYQDCTIGQHAIICALAPHFPTCVFGDPLQAIFDFRGQTPVGWEDDVFPVFPQTASLTKPWRWENAGNEDLANWLRGVRTQLENGQSVDLAASPDCVTWEQCPLPDKSSLNRAQRQGKLTATLGTINAGDDQNLVIIADSANVKARVNFAKSLSRFGCTNIEAVQCDDLFEFAARLDATSGMDRLECALDIAAACMTRAERAPLLNAVKSHLAGGKAGAKKFATLIPLCIAVTRTTCCDPLFRLFSALYAQGDTRVYRRDMHHALCSALCLMSTGRFDKLTNAAWEAQNRARHRGRVLARRSIGSTLLIKGLEFDHAVIMDASRLDRKHLYVALTRPIRTLTVFSPSPVITPRA